MRRLLLLLAVAGAIGALAAPAAHAGMAAKVTVGIAEQQPGFFGTPLFERTGLRHARLLVGWNALTTRWQREEVDRWLAAAHAAGAEPLVTFGRSRTNTRLLPSTARFLRAFRDFRARYPWVRSYATWNEANHCGEPTCRRPERVAAYWRGMRRACPSCRILAAELVDQPNIGAWARAFRRASVVEPRYWGLHNYLDANRFSSRYTSEALAATRGELWLTETGGIVRRNNASPIRLSESPGHAAQATRFLFDRLLRVSPRITRLYVYHWTAEPRGASWDSALVSATGSPRPAYAVLRDRLRRLRSAGRLR